MMRNCYPNSYTYYISYYAKDVMDTDAVPTIRTPTDSCICDSFCFGGITKRASRDLVITVRKLPPRRNQNNISPRKSTTLNKRTFISSLWYQVLLIVWCLWTISWLSVYFRNFSSWSLGFVPVIIFI